MGLRVVKYSEFLGLVDWIAHGRISEDQKFSQKEKMEKIIENGNKKIADISAKKEKEIMEV